MEEKIETNEINEQEENKETTGLKLPEPIVITKLTSDEPAFDVTVENERVALLAANKKASRRSTITMVVMIILLILSMIFVYGSYPVIGYILLGVAAVLIITVMILNKRVAKPDVKGYISRASTAINRFIFNSNDFENVVYDPTDKMDLSEVIADGVYEGVVNLASRNVVTGTYKENSFKVCELALFQGAGRSKRTAFVGKYLSLLNNLHFEGRFVFTIKSTEKEYDTATGVDDLKSTTDGEITIYQPEGVDYKNIFPKEFLNSLKKVKVINHLLNINVVVWAGRTVVYASYDDETVSLPFYEKTKAAPTQQYKSDLHKLLDASLVLIEK